MTVYIVVPLSNESIEPARDAVSRKIAAGDWYALPNNRGWLVKFPGTAMEISNLLEITGQTLGDPALIHSALVCPVTSYYGRAPTDIWDWLRSRMEQ